jgi:histidine ammonia-lyase
MKSSRRLENALRLVRAQVPPYTADRFFAPDIEAAKKLVISGKLRALLGDELFTS